jgi:hypothetical protein
VTRNVISKMRAGTMYHLGSLAGFLLAGISVDCTAAVSRRYTPQAAGPG